MCLDTSLKSYEHFLLEDINVNSRCEAISGKCKGSLHVWWWTHNFPYAQVLSPSNRHCCKGARLHSVTVSSYHGFTITGLTVPFVSVCHMWNGPRWQALISLAETLKRIQWFFFFPYRDYLLRQAGRLRLDRFHQALSLINSITLSDAQRGSPTQHNCYHYSLFLLHV